jgi:hypothetical protein
MLKCKLDENLDPRAKAILQQAGLDVLTVQEQDLRGAADESIATLVRGEGRCLITLDLDFADVLAYPPRLYNGIIVLRHPRPTIEGMLRLVGQLALAFQDHNPTGQLWVVEPGRLRVHG